MRQCTRLIRFLKKGRVPQSSIAASFFLRTVLLHLPSTPLSLSIKHAVIKCTTICQIGWKKHEWGSSIITSHKVTDNLVIHWRSTTVSRQTSMSDSNRLWFSLYVPFFFFFLLLHLSIEKVNWKKFEKNFKRKDLVSNIFDDLPNYIYLRGFWKGNRRDESDIETATSNVIAIMGFFLKMLICN